MQHSCAALQALAAAAFLPRLRELVLFRSGNNDEPAPLALPGAPALATALQTLDAAAARGCL